MGLYPCTIKVLDASSPTRGVAGARFVIEGRAYMTAGDGSTTIEYTSSDSPGSYLGYQIAITATGYNAFSSEAGFTRLDGTTSPLTFRIDPDGTNVVTLVKLVSTQGTPLAGANVYLDASPALVADHLGQVPVTYALAASHKLKATCNGYRDQSVSVTPGQNVPDAVVLTTLDQNVPFTLHLRPGMPAEGGTAPTSGASVTITINGSPQSYTADGSGLVAVGITGGSNILVSATKDGFDSITDQPFLVDQGHPDGYIDLTPTSGTDTDPNAASGPGGPETLPITAPITLQASTKDVDDIEWIYPNSEYGKYFTATQARMYIGNLFIDELESVQYTLQANRIPIYGYASRDYDAVATGRALVQGQLAINFVSEGYLYTVLKEYRKLATQQFQQDLEQQDQQYLQKVLERRNQLQTALRDVPPEGHVVRMMHDEDPTDEYNAVQGEITKIAGRGPEVLAGAYRQLTQYTVFNANKYVNAVYLPVSFDIEIQLEGAGREVGEKRTVTRRLERCFLGANSQVLSQDGSEVLDQYSFIARRLR